MQTTATTQRVFELHRSLEVPKVEDVEAEGHKWFKKAE
jgi:hypothetical protein